MPMSHAFQKLLTSVAIVVVLLLVIFAVAVYELLSRKAYVSVVSPSGKYIIESVAGASLLTPRETVYLRFYERENPAHVYRTPLFPELALDMRAREDEAEVGVVFIYLDKKANTFSLALSRPDEHWMNRFISNTSYMLMEN